MRTSSFSRSAAGVVRQLDLARLEHVAAVRDRQRDRGVLLDHEHGRPLLVDLDDDLEDPVDQDRRESHRRLVEQQQPGPRHQGAADRAHLLLAARERAGLLRLALLEPREQAVRAIEVLGDAVGVRALVGAELEVLAHGHAREQAPALGALRDAELDDVVRRTAGDVVAREGDLPRPWRDDPVDRAQRGRLARAVRADQRDDLAVVHLERDALERLDAAVGRAQALDPRAAARPRRRRCRLAHALPSAAAPVPR